MARKTTKKAKEEQATVSVGKPTAESYEILRRPILSEQSTNIMETQNKITLEVKKDANKVAIKNAFESIFGVKVKKVNTSYVRPKSKRVGRHAGKTSAYKKAIITLKEGQALDLFKE